MTKNELQRRVNKRKQELSEQAARFDGLLQKVSAFVKEMQNRSVIYNLLKNLPIWKELEALIGEDT